MTGRPRRSPGADDCLATIEMARLTADALMDARKAGWRLCSVTSGRVCSRSPVPLDASLAALMLPIRYPYSLCEKPSAPVT